HAHPVILGQRRGREDGFFRTVASRVLSLVVLIASQAWIRDSNVPYRLMSRRALAEALEGFPEKIHLANVLLSRRLRARKSIHWIRIGFRDRFGGSPSVKPLGFAKHGLKLFTQLRQDTLRPVQPVLGARPQPEVGR